MALFDNCVAAWKLDDLTDATGRGNTLTNNNSTTFNTGKIGNAAYFTAASSQYLSIASNADVALGAGDYTIGVWVYLTDKSADYVCLAKDIDTSREYLIIYVASSDRFQFAAFNSSQSAIVVTDSHLGSPSTGTWYCIVCWHDTSNNSANMSINNGTADSATDANTPWHTGSGDLNIGRRSYPGFLNYLNGRVDNANLWNVVKNSTDRTAFYNGGAGIEFGGSQTIDMWGLETNRPVREKDQVICY